MNFDQFRVLTFDCYGTLVDWETGIRNGLRPLLERHRIALTDDELLESYGVFEARTEAGAYCTYTDVLREVVRQFGAKYGFTPSASESDALVDSFAEWKPFADTVEALKALHTRFKLAILSNVDDALFALTAPQLEVPFDAVITAEQAQSYKPSHRNFELAFARLGVPKAQILHVAQSLYHDIAPAKELHLANVWVNRRHDKPGSGATPPAFAQPDVEVPDLRTLASLALPPPSFSER